MWASDNWCISLLILCFRIAVGWSSCIVGQEAYIHTSGGIVQIAGTVGTGFFLGSGGALATAGPLGALIAYLLVGTTAYSCVMFLSYLITSKPMIDLFALSVKWQPGFPFLVHSLILVRSRITTPFLSHQPILQSSWSLGWPCFGLCCWLGKFFVFSELWSFITVQNFFYGIAWATLLDAIFWILLMWYRISIPTEISAATVLVTFWDSNVCRF